MKTKELQLTQKKIAIIDEADFDRCFEHRWCLSKGYAASTINKKQIRLHRFLLNVNDPLIEVDHINGNPLDNRRCNLRQATKRQNRANTGKRKNNTSGYKGVHYTKRRSHLFKPWAAYLGTLGKNRFLGYFESAIEAAKAYDKAAFEMHGEFARLNFK